MFSNYLILGRGLSKASTKLNAIRTAHLAADGKPRENLTARNVKFIINPDEKLIDEYMKVHGNQRSNFKRNDFDTWKKCFEDRYSVVFACLKDTNQIVHTSHYINYYPVAPHIDTPHQYQGFFWIHPDFRGVDSMRMGEYVGKMQLRNVSDCALSLNQPQSMNLWKKGYGHNKYGHIQNVSYYKPEEMQVPKNLKFDGIFVKNATEVPDEDIVKYDQTVFPFERSKHILNVLREPAAVGKVAYDENGKVIGFGSVIIYPSGECVLTPLYAEDKKVAQAIFKNILEQIQLEDKKFSRFEIRSIDKSEEGFEWVQPFVMKPIQKKAFGYMCYTTHLPYMNYNKVFSNSPNAIGAI